MMNDTRVYIALRTGRVGRRQAQREISRASMPILWKLPRVAELLLYIA